MKLFLQTKKGLNMNSIKPYLCLVLFALITGTTFQVAKEALLYFSPAQTGALRFVLASILLFTFVFLSDRKLLKVNKEHLRSFIFLGIVGVFGFNFFFFHQWILSLRAESTRLKPEGDKLNSCRIHRISYASETSAS